MCDAFDGIGKGVREVVHREYAPLRADPVMRHILDAKQDRIAHVDVARFHVDLCAKNMSAFREFAGPHALEHYELNGDHTGLAPQVVATIERDLGGVPVSAADRAEKMTRGTYIAAPGDYWWVGDSLVHFFAGPHQLEVRLLAGPSGPVERIAKRVDALVGAGGDD